MPSLRSGPTLAVLLLSPAVDILAFHMENLTGHISPAFRLCLYIMLAVLLLRWKTSVIHQSCMTSQLLPHSGSLVSQSCSEHAHASQSPGQEVKGLGQGARMQMRGINTLPLGCYIARSFHYDRLTQTICLFVPVDKYCLTCLLVLEYAS